jgi:hypothetical protein
LGVAGYCSIVFVESKKNGFLSLKQKLYTWCNSVCVNLSQIMPNSLNRFSCAVVDDSNLFWLIVSMQAYTGKRGCNARGGELVEKFAGYCS